MVSPRGLEPQQLHSPPSPSEVVSRRGLENISDEFEEFCQIDLQLNKETTHRHKLNLTNFLLTVKKQIHELTTNDVRTYLAHFNKYRAKKTYANNLCTLKRFFRDFLKRNDIVDSFRFPTRSFNGYRKLPTKDELKSFYMELSNSQEKFIFLLLASSGLRKSEVFSSRFRDVNFKTRMLNSIGAHETARTKNSWISFYNEEADNYLKLHLKNRNNEQDQKIFTMHEKTLRKHWKKIKEKTGVYVTPQILREWFACEMGRLGVPDRYVDA